MSTEDENIIYSKNAIEFVTVAAEFVAFVENYEKLDRKNFIEKLHKILALLYLKASLIPEFDSMFNEVLEKYFTEEDWISLKNSIAGKLGGFDKFIRVDETIAQLDDESTSVSVSECITDIYQDLFDFLQAYRFENSELMHDALWECLENFKYYWGQRLIGVLNIFHSFIYGNFDLNSDKE